MRRDDLSKLIVERALESIRAGKKEDAVKYVSQLWDECVGIERFLSEVISSILSFTAERLGEESVVDAWRQALKDCWKPAVMALKDMDYEQVVDFYPRIHRAVGSEFHVDQDAEKTVITITSCGTAGRMMKEGKFDNTDRHPLNFRTTKKVYPWSCNKVGIPFYCVRAAFMFDILPKEWGWDAVDHRYGRQFDDEGNPVNEPCRLTIYKNPGKRVG